MTFAFAHTQNYGTPLLSIFLLDLSPAEKASRMDNNVSAKYFHVRELDISGGAFETILQGIAEKELSDREANIGPANGSSVVVRLECLETDGNYVFGEITRKQTDNKPPQADMDGLSPLPLSGDAGLGHSVAFRFHRPTYTLLLQNNPNGVSHSRLYAYLKAHAPQSDIRFERVPTENALERFNNNTVRGFEVVIGSPLNLPSIEDSGPDQAVTDAARMLGEAFNGLTVSVSVSVGKSKGSLDKGPILKVIERLVPWNTQGQADVRKLRVKSKELSGDGDQDVIDFLDEFMQERTTLDLSDSDPSQNYLVRRLQLSTWHASKVPYLTNVYQTTN